MRRPVVPCVALVLGLVMAPGPAEASREKKPGPGSPETSTLVERATVEMVLIEAYVTDVRGLPIEGLGPNDFILMVDGHVRPISSLEFRSVRAAPAEKRYPRRFIVFYEDRTSHPTGLTAARLATKRFLAESLVPDDEVALAAFDNGLRLLHDFTSDRQALKESVEASLVDPKRFSDFGAQYGLAEGGLARPRAASVQQALGYGSNQTPRARGALGALGTLIDSLAPYPGFKAIIFMGDGVAENPAFDYYIRSGGDASRFPLGMEGRRFDLSQDIYQVGNAAAAAGVTLFSVQTAGLALETSADLRRTVRASNALETIALNTGGTYATTNDLFKALSDAEVASRAYYVLGYAPEGPPDGKYHTVQLRLRKTEGHLRWRRGFARPLPHDARAHAVQAAYVLPELYTRMGVELSLVLGPSDRTTRTADLVIHVPPGRALFVPRSGGPTAWIEAGFVMIDATKHETLRAARETHIALGTGSDPGTSGLDFYSRIHVPRAGQTITAVVSDRSSGDLGAARLVVPPGDAGSPVIGLSIYSLSEKSLWVEIPAVQEQTPAADQPVEFSVGPALKSTFAVGEPLACGLRLEGPDSGIRLVIRSGERIVRTLPVAAMKTEEESGAGPPVGSIRMPLTVDDLTAGDYVLAAQASGDGADGPDLAAVPFRLRARPADEDLPQAPRGTTRASPPDASP